VSTDVALLNRIVARDPNALAELYDRYSRLLFGLILRILKNRDEAEEIMQDAFVQAWTRATTYRAEIASPAGWLVGIARNRAIDRLRANAIRANARQTASPVAGGSSDAGSAGAEQIDIRRALQLLPADQRDLVESAYFLGLTHVELAERHGLPLGTVKTRIRRAMQTLRDYLDGKVIQS
jgi:RNA polymerase sigma-70 factor (ECF subfamily)